MVAALLAAGAAANHETAPHVVVKHGRPPRTVEEPPLQYPVDGAWNGLTIDCYVRNSDPKQRGNARSEAQVDMGAYLLGLGFAIRINDEQGRSGGRLAARQVMRAILERIEAGRSDGIGVLDLKRLTRDERGLDPAYIGY